MVVFLGSTLGNFNDAEHDDFWSSMAEYLPSGDHFLLGVDLVKDAETVEAAYNDAAGITARFTKNLFVRMNRELGSRIDIGQIEHVAKWSPEQQRINTSARFLSAQQVHVEATDDVFEIAAGEHIQLEISRKFRLPELAEDLARYGFKVRRTFTDDNEWFGLLLLQRA
jgi:L-histidine N-alpha-methyltransferase